MDGSRYGILIDSEEKRDLIDTAFLYLDRYEDSRTNMDQAEEVLERDQDTLRKHRTGDIGFLPLDLADSLYSVLNQACPAVDLLNPEKYRVESGDRSYARDGMYDVNDFAQSWVFRRLSYDEFEEITGKSRSAFNRYRNNKSKRINFEFFVEAVDHIRDKISTEFNPKGCQIVDKKKYQHSSRDEAYSEPSIETKQELMEDFEWLAEINTDGVSLHNRFKHLFTDDQQKDKLVQ